MDDAVTKTGKVYLVGAGPGDPGLLTIRGRQLLEQADFVLYDSLVNPLLLRYTQAEAERTARVPGPSFPVLPQDEINARLIEAARAGKTVVRLKGGDPFIFGRGSEEAAALAAAGIPFEVVPGVTAAVAAGEYAGISLTHRELASAVAFITGHENPEKGRRSIDYDVLARFPGTLVFYMGLHRLETITSSLMDAGKPASTPACVISRASTPLQRVVTGTLADLPAAVRAADLHPPSLILVGEVVRMRSQIAWFENRPLLGKRIGITRPEGQADNAIARCLELGAQPVLLPTIRIEPPSDWSAVDAMIPRLGEFDWILFTSVNGVAGLLGRMWDQGGDARRLGSARLAAIGPGTEDALEAFHLRADLIPEAFRAEALAAALAPHVAGRRVLWVRASRGRDVLPVELEKAGAMLEQLVVYQNLDVEALPDAERTLLEQGDLDWIALSSPSIARSLARLLPESARNHIGTRIRLASISPVTTAAARDVELPIAAEAETYTWEGIFEAIVKSESEATRD